jgi:histidinol-phosphate aminotransferase
MPVTRRGFVHLLGAGTVGSLLAPATSARGLESLTGARAGRTRAVGDDVVRLDSNENPYGPGRAAVDAITLALGGVHRYPDDAVDALRAGVARHFHVAPENVCLGCGSTDVLRAAVYAFTSPRRALVTASPTYESPGLDASRVRTPVREVRVRGDLRLDLAAMADASRGAGLVYLCNPNNPTATVYGSDAVNDFIARVLRATPDCTILVDEAYHDYVDDPRYATAVPVALENPRVVVARTFSKVHGMAGLRVGYALGHRDTIAKLAPHTLDLGVNAIGAAGALASLGAVDHIDRQRALNREAREFTRRFFVDAGYAPSESQSNFVMVDVRRDAKTFREACEAQGVRIGRLFPPLLTHARVTIGTMDEMRRATDVFRRILASA